MVKVIDADKLSAFILANQRDEYVAPAPTPVPAPSGDGLVPNGIPGTFSRKFFDHFDGASLSVAWGKNWLGASGAITKPVNSAELAAYDPAQVSVANSYLQLTSKKKVVTATDGKTYQYTSGLVHTSKTFEFTVGVFEAKILMPPTSNPQIPYNWGAAWTNGHHVSWPDQVEIDTMENLTGGPAWHLHAPSVNIGKTILKNWNDWHTYAHYRKANGDIEFFYDGVSVGLVSGVKLTSNYLVLNYALSTQHGGPLAVDKTMLVDYVGVWTPA